MKKLLIIAMIGLLSMSVSADSDGVEVYWANNTLAFTSGAKASIKDGVITRKKGKQGGSFEEMAFNYGYNTGRACNRGVDRNTYNSISLLRTIEFFSKGRELGVKHTKEKFCFTSD